MKSRNTTLDRPRFLEIEITGPSPFFSVTNEPWRHSRVMVTPGALVQGNKKDPNPWNYTCFDLKYLNGTNVKNTYYTSGPSTGSRVSEREIGGVAFDDNHQLWVAGTFPTYLENAALSRLNEKVRGTLDLSVLLAQAGLTVRMFRASENARLFLQTFRGWRGLIKGTSEARLAFAYGWSPLASDIYSTANESVRLVINEIEHVRARMHENVPSGTSYVPVRWYGSCPVKMVRNGKFVCQYGLKFKTKGYDIARWSSLNPLSLAWELLPYSFVVDWVYDVGSYLRDLETSLLYANSFVNGYKTIGTFYDVTGSAGAYRRESNSYGYSEYIVSATTSGRYRSLVRTKLVSYPAPRLPSFKADLGSGRLLNLAALIGGKLRI